MSANLCAHARTSPAGAHRRAAVLALALPLAATLAIRASSAADPSVAAVRFGAEAARHAGFALELVARPDLPVELIEIRSAGSPPGHSPISAFPPEVLLAVGPGGRSVAMAGRVGPDPTTLILAEADGAQVRVPMNGLLAAAFSPDASWLAAANGSGQLLRVSRDGGVEAIADGPFIGPIIVEPSGAVLALAVSSVEAPFVSYLTRVDLAGGSVTRLSGEELVYSVQQLTDGSLAVVAHRPTGTIVERFGAGAGRVEVDLGPGAVNVSVSGGLEAIAWERNGEVFVSRDGGSSAKSLGSGGTPRLAEDASALLVDRDGGPVLLDLDGAVLAELAGAAAFVGCGECGS